MQKKLSLALILVALLAACSKEEEKPAEAMSRVANAMSSTSSIGMPEAAKEAAKGAPSSAPPVSVFLHDIDMAQAVLAKYPKDPSQNQDKPDFLAAFEAMQKVQFLGECWPTKTDGSNPYTTANTNHECLDKKGFKR